MGVAQTQTNVVQEIENFNRDSRTKEQTRQFYSLSIKLLSTILVNRYIYSRFRVNLLFVGWFRRRVGKVLLQDTSSQKFQRVETNSSRCKQDWGEIEARQRLIFQVIVWSKFYLFRVSQFYQPNPHPIIWVIIRIYFRSEKSQWAQSDSISLLCYQSTRLAECQKDRNLS